MVLLLHGEPSWWYLYRKMIRVLVKARLRVIAPDMIGMGRSDKPVEFSRYRYLQHVAWVEAFVDHVRVRRRLGAQLEEFSELDRGLRLQIRVALAPEPTERADLLETLDALLAFETSNRMRTKQKLGGRKVAELLERAVLSPLGDARCADQERVG